MIDEFINGFIEEAKELLFQMEDDLISLEKKPDESGTINNIFRVMHTLKGSAGMVGFKNIQNLTHEFENIYERIRTGELKADTSIIDLTLKAKDLIIDMLNKSGEDFNDPEFMKLVRQTAGNKMNLLKPKVISKTELGTSDNFYIIFFKPHKGIFERGLDPDKILEEIRASGEMVIIEHSGKKSWLKQKAEKSCHTRWEIYVRTHLILSEMEDIFLFYEEEEYQIFKMNPEQITIDPALAVELGKIYKHRKVPELHIRNAFEQLPEIKSGISQPETYKSVDEAPAPEVSKTETDATVNVSSHKLDELMNLVSELVTITDTLEVYTSKLNDSKLNNAIEQIEKLTKKFRNNALDLRLVPVGSLLSKFKRQVRDLSKELGKKVNLLIDGQDIEIDKTILRSIESPLQHIIRNSLDHGIESEDVRRIKGKSPEGLLKITAFYSGASVILQIQDDGGGINLERVKECAIKKGYIQAEQNVTKEDLLTLIMEPGFTTNENISIVSGRGVGMDVVRRELNSVGGSLEVFTEKDLGTSITMKLPTTLTIIDTLMVEIGETLILIPVMDIEYCFQEDNEKLFHKDNKYIQYKNSPIPLVSLREQFRYPCSQSQNLMVIVINKFDRRYAITADKIIGEHQAVIKPLGDLFVNQAYFSGGSIMVDGKLAFILDTNFLFSQVNKKIAM